MKYTRIFTTCIGLSVIPVASLAATATWTTESGGNGHTYEIVLESVSWQEAKALAEASTFGGQSGYLATITSAEEQAFIDNLYMPRTTVSLPVGDGGFDDFSSLWLGASDADEEGVWKWVVGPEAGELVSDFYENWDQGEPNDFGDGEDYMAGWFVTSRGDVWNDLPEDLRRFVVGYVAEYDAAVVPLPGAAWFLIAGLGGLGILRKRRG